MRADVCLVVEGAYPYVTGGVAAWTHQLVCGLPEVNFALLVILPDESFAAEDKYPVPKNVVARSHVTLFDAHKQKREAEASPELVAAIEQFHAVPSGSRCPVFGPLVRLMGKGRQTAYALESARTSWNLITKFYQQRRREVSFLDYFWTWKATHGPLFRLLDAPLPEAPVYHPLSTGYAGALAAIARQRLGAEVLLTEHGIYTRERVIEIAQAEWIFQEPVEGSSYAPREEFFKSWWRSQYDFLGKLAYDAASRIVTLNDVNKRFQIEAGAPAEKLVHVPNGVPLEPYAASRHVRDWKARPFRVGLVGRVVPIKDIKTFLRAVQLAAHEVPVEAYVIGPTDEDPAYYAECQELVRLLDLEGTVVFTGPQNVAAWLGKLDVNVLTSVSESQPLVLLEGWAAGVPAVTTDVGACREMVEGRPGEDALLGPAGLVTPVATPEATARALVALARDPERHAAMAAAGIERVSRYYRQEHVFEAYRGLYRELAAAGRAGVR
jgi:glycosyltransferase involved in cell wall biosynthesis